MSLKCGSKRFLAKWQSVELCGFHLNTSFPALASFAYTLMLTFTLFDELLVDEGISDGFNPRNAVYISSDSLYNSLITDMVNYQLRVLLLS